MTARPDHLYRTHVELTSKVCAYCGVGKVTDWTPGWPSWVIYFGPDGNEVRSEPPCTTDMKRREDVDAEIALDDLEALAS